MKTLRLLCLLGAWAGAVLSVPAAEGPLQMEPFRVSASDFYLQVEYAIETQRVVAIRVSNVTPRSGAERRGIRKGDRIVAIDGVPVVTLLRSQVLHEGRILVREELTLEGSRGLLRKKWSTTVHVVPEAGQANAAQASQ